MKIKSIKNPKTQQFTQPTFWLLILFVKIIHFLSINHQSFNNSNFWANLCWFREKRSSRIGMLNTRWSFWKKINNICFGSNIQQLWRKRNFQGGGPHLGHGLSHVHSCGFAKFQGLPLKLIINEFKINTPMNDGITWNNLK